MLERAVDAALGMSVRPRVVAVVPSALVEDARGLLPGDVVVVAGGETRQGSVAAGLGALSGSGVGVVLVHDAARAFMPSRVFDAVEAEVLRTGAGVVPGLPVVDTIKEVEPAGSSAGVRSTVRSTVDRSLLRAVQTPQGFLFGELVSAYGSVSGEHTDDAALFAAAGFGVSVVEGDPLGFKVTVPADLERARSLVPPQSFVGLGVDVHAFGPDGSGSLWLGDLEWPGEAPLVGHSDGDVLCHALCDALLSAAGLGDLGSVFGSGDPRFEGAHGRVFVGETVARVSSAGFTVGNVSVQVLGNRPRVSERRVELEEHLSGLVGAPVRVSASTTDGLGFAGRGEGLTAIATALLTRV